MAFMIRATFLWLIGARPVSSLKLAAMRLSAVKTMLIIKDGCYSRTNKLIGMHLYPALFAGADPFIKRGTIQL